MIDWFGGGCSDGCGSCCSLSHRRSAWGVSRCGRAHFRTAFILLRHNLSERLSFVDWRSHFLCFARNVLFLQHIRPDQLPPKHASVSLVRQLAGCVLALLHTHGCVYLCTVFLQQTACDSIAGGLCRCAQAALCCCVCLTEAGKFCITYPPLPTEACEACMMWLNRGL